MLLNKPDVIGPPHGPTSLALNMLTVTFNTIFPIHGPWARLTHAFQHQPCNTIRTPQDLAKSRRSYDIHSNLTTHTRGYSKLVSVVYCGGRREPHKLVVWPSLTSLECCTPARGGHTTQWTEGDVYCYKRRHVSGCKLKIKCDVWETGMA